MLDIRTRLKEADSELLETRNDSERSIIKSRVQKIGSDFLQLEKFVNLNFTGILKILKKHDRFLPNPCKPFYISRLHNQSWTRGEYSDVIVALSRIHSVLRGDEAGAECETEKQDFVRSTRKYWVRTEDVSQVKYIILQHLPVFLQKSMGNECDSQLTNSVYLDNAQLELYHNRLDKTAGCIAIRFRWYGPQSPTVVFVERKTHREGWTGDESIKERFTVPEGQILNLLNGKYDIEAELTKMRLANKSKKEIDDWEVLVTEISQAIGSKQLLPVVRTQYMRTAFQIPFDATVRLSLDTNLCMILERTTSGSSRWFRDPQATVPASEISRFPHAVLEVKLQVADESATPVWVRELLDSGILMEIHKFSKFIHGTAVLLHDEVQSVPYWIDDASLHDSIVYSGASEVLNDVIPNEDDDEDDNDQRAFFQHLLPHDKLGRPKNSRPVMQSYQAIEATDDVESNGSVDNRLKSPKVMDKIGASMGWPVNNLKRALGSSALTVTHSMGPISINSPASEAHNDTGKPHLKSTQQSSQAASVTNKNNEPSLTELLCGCCGEWTYDVDEPLTMSFQKVEPKLIFANERTFLHWMGIAVTLSSLSTAFLAFSSSGELAEIFGLMLVPVSLVICGYALRTFLWRDTRIRNRDAARWDDPMGPLFVGSMVIIALIASFVLESYDLIMNANQQQTSTL